MFTLGRIIFALIFALTFIGFMIYSYKKDSKSHDIYYKNTAVKVAIALVVTIVLLVASKYVLK
ncbi:conserved hypothetical protein [Tenacibaculum maritimum]|nr:conserved hypothetical protein [Tenacibaculum maritimum]